MENKNTIISGSKLDFSPKVKPAELFYNYKYELEPNDTFMKCTTRSEAITEWKSEGEDYEALYEGEMPINVSNQLLCEENTVFRFLGIKIDGIRHFCLYPKTI